MASDIFTGASRYSTDFQSVIDRTINIASLPMLQMQQQRVSMSDEASALKSLDTALSKLQTSLKDLGDSFGFGSYSVSNSDGSALQAKIADGVMEGSYTVKVLEVGSYATASTKSSLTKITDPATQSFSSSRDFQLSINGGEAKEIHAANDNLNSLVEAINNANAGVRATIVNLSPSGTPDYRLSIQSTSLGPVSVSLKNEDAELLDAPVGGAVARYIVNGSAEESTSNSRTVTLSTGLTVDLVKETATPVTVAVTRGTESVKASLEKFVNSYNMVVDEINKHYGASQGALSGNSIVSTAAHVLRDIGSYAPSYDGMSSLASIGILSDKQGKLYLDSSEWDKAKSDFSGLKNLVGSLTGSGFLKKASSSIETLQNADTGILKTTIKSTEEQIETFDGRLTEEQRRIDDLRLTLQDRFAAADSLIAALEQQASYFVNMFAAMKASQESMG